MPDFQGSESITQAEHISPNKTGDNVQAKRTANYVWNSSTLEWERMTQPGGSSSSGGKATDAYGYQAKSDDGTYTYWFFEDASLNWYVRRKHNTTLIHDFTKGTGGYESVYVDKDSAPSGSPTYDTYGATF